MYTNISNIKILRVTSSMPVAGIEDAVNKVLAEGYTLLKIDTVAPEELPGQSSRTNFFVYHFGKAAKTNI